MLLNHLFYTVKPLIPRRVQIALRRRIAAHKRRKYAHFWPIDPNAATPPPGWQGWPEGKQFALVLSHDVDTRRGYDTVLKLADLEEKMGFRSQFNFVPERYGEISLDLLDELRGRGFGIGVHGLKHDGTLFRSKRDFDRQAPRINAYLENWKTTGFTSPSMHRNMDWMVALNITHSISTFDTDPFEPQPDGAGTIFPFEVFKKDSEQSAVSSQQKRVSRKQGALSSRPPSCVASSLSSLPASQPSGNDPSALSFELAPSSHDPSALSFQLPPFFVELPYTLVQDFTLLVLMREKGVDIWKKKLDWIAGKGGMALLNVHPDYMNFGGGRRGREEYPAEYYADFLDYVNQKYHSRHWHVLPREIAQFWVTYMSHHRTGPDLSGLKFDDGLVRIKR